MELPDRELSVLTGYARGLTNAEISNELYLSVDTVKTYSRRLFKRLGAKSQAHAVSLGYQHGLLVNAQLRAQLAGEQPSCPKLTSMPPPYGGTQ